jgi:hypothetical protein
MELIVSIGIGLVGICLAIFYGLRFRTCERLLNDYRRVDTEKRLLIDRLSNLDPTQPGSTYEAQIITVRLNSLNRTQDRLFARTTMGIESGLIDRNISITNDFTLLGTIGGNTTVENGGTFTLNGACQGNLFVKAGAKALLYGTVQGSVYNQGGSLEVWGVIYGNLLRESGETFIDHNAVIQGTVL